MTAEVGKGSYPRGKFRTYVRRILYAPTSIFKIAKVVAIIRKDRIHSNNLTLGRDEGHLDVFELK